MPARPARMNAGNAVPSSKLLDQQENNNNNNNRNDHQNHQIRITHTTGSAPLPPTASGFTNTNTVAASSLILQNNNNNPVGTMTLPAGMTMEMIKQQAMASSSSLPSCMAKPQQQQSSSSSGIKGNIDFVVTPNNNKKQSNNNLLDNNNNNNGDGFVVVAEGSLRVGKDGISIVDPEHSNIPVPKVHIEDLIEEKILDRSNDTVVALYRRREPFEYPDYVGGDSNEQQGSGEKNNNNNNTDNQGGENNNKTESPATTTKKERYAVKILQIKNKRDTLHIVAAEVGSAFMNRSDFTVTLKNAYLRGSELILIMEYMDGRSLFDLLKNLHDLGRTMREVAVAYITHRMLLALRMLHEGLFIPPSVVAANNKIHKRTVSKCGSDGKSHTRNLSTGSTNSSFGVSPAGAASSLQSTSNNTSPTITTSNSYCPPTIKRVVHRDIKPSNILLNSSGAVKLADFGVAGSTDSIGLATFVGTVNYMCPERIQGRGYNTPSDIWSLGVVVAEMLLGYHPFLAPSPITSINSNATPPNSGTNSGMNSLQGGMHHNQNNNNMVSPAPINNNGNMNNGGGPMFPGSVPPTTSGGGGGGGGGGCVGFCELFERVTKCNGYNIGPGFTDDAVDFVRRCLQQDPDKRLSAAELLRHPWIAKFGDSMSLCANQFLASRMMSNTTSGFVDTATSTPNMANNNNNNNDENQNVVSGSPLSLNQATATPTHPAASASTPQPPMDSHDFAHYVYDIRKEAREQEAERKRAERHELRRREKMLLERQNNNAATASGNGGMLSIGNSRSTTNSK